jgi:hypothetical protein
MSRTTQAQANRQPRVFISYRRDDAASAAGRLRDHMESRFAPECIFMDVDTIEVGADVRATIRAAVLASDVLIAVIGRSWASVTDARGRRRLDDDADWVRVEIATALQAGIVAIPVLVDDARMPAVGSLPGDLAALLDRNAFEIRNTRFAADVNKFLDALMVAARRAVDVRAARSAAPPTPRAVPIAPHRMGADTAAAHRESVPRGARRSPAPAAASHRVAAPIVAPGPQSVATAPGGWPWVRYSLARYAIVGAACFIPLGPIFLSAVARHKLRAGNLTDERGLFWRNVRGISTVISIAYVALVALALLSLLLTS